MRRWLVAGALLASCGDNAGLPLDASRPPRPDASPPAAACAATFSGNFAERVAMSPDCAMLSGQTTLTFAVPSYQPTATVAIAIPLGATPELGQYTSETVAAWSAMATVAIGDANCIYLAGATAVPPGSFTLTLDAIDVAGHTAHGRLVLELGVLPGAETDCGPSNAETLDLAF